MLLRRYHEKPGHVADGGRDGVVPEHPDGDPSEDWTGAQLKAYAKAKDISLGGATKKADMLAAVEAARQGEQPDGAPAPDGDPQGAPAGGGAPEAEPSDPDGDPQNGDPDGTE